MNVRKILQRRIRHSGGGVNAVGDINAVVAGNVNEPGSHTHVSTSQRTRVVQRGGETKVYEQTTEGEDK
jgi:hypothetical protein